MVTSATFATTIAPPALDELCINTLRFLAVDMVQKATRAILGCPWGRGHGIYLYGTDRSSTTRANPHWPDRDRFILSAGHGCALLYALLHVTGFRSAP